MKAQIQFKQTNGDNGVALIDAALTNLEQAKRELANKLNLPEHEDLDTRLRNGGIDPASLTFDMISE